MHCGFQSLDAKYYTIQANAHPCHLTHTKTSPSSCPSSHIAFERKRNEQTCAVRHLRQTGTSIILHQGPDNTHEPHQIIMQGPSPPELLSGSGSGAMTSTWRCGVVDALLGTCQDGAA
jgi:hypothetical protein